MNKIVNGVANDYEFPMYYESNIRTLRDKEESIIAWNYVNQEKEIERLNNIINEFEKWLEQEYAVVKANSILEPNNLEWYIKWNERKNTFDKLQELKGDYKNDNIFISKRDVL